MRYDLSRLDGDPGYAPGRVEKGTAVYWRPPKGDVKDGYDIRSYRLSGTFEDQAAKCRELTRRLLAWRDGEATKIQTGTWGWIIQRFQTDELSTIHDVKANTAKSYIDESNYWMAAIPGLKVRDTDFATLKMLKKGMEQKGRSVAFIKRKFTHLRIIASYGLAVDTALFRDICAILEIGALKLKAPKARTVSPTPDQIGAIIAAADAAGDTGFALGISLQWWLTLRAVDVRGQWLGPLATRRWADGLTWDMIDLPGAAIRKMISKTEKNDLFEMVWRLDNLPDVIARLEAIPAGQRIGPVIRNKAGAAFERRHYTELFRRYARAADVPDDVQMMDTRAGAINDALAHGAEKLDLQHAANHKSFETTERYIRTRDVGANKVIALRTGTKK